MEDLHLIAKVYDTYSHAKEKFIDRNFQTNRYFMVLCLTLVFATYAAKVLIPDIMPVVILSAFGLLISLLWYINIDTYNFMIKVKYANVLEKIEENFPIQPYKSEFQSSQEIKKNKKLAIFPDLQKGFALCILLIFVWYFSTGVATRVMKSPFEQKNIPPAQVEAID